MSIDLAPLATARRLLFTVPLRPLQGHRFQPTGFPDLGAASYQAPQADGEAISCLLIESPQSMANRLEAVCWDPAARDVVSCLRGLSYVCVQQNGTYLTSSITEAHRLNSPYILESGDGSFFSQLKTALAPMEQGPIDRGELARTLFRYDANSLLHGVFLAKKELAGGRLRVARVLSAFVEAEGTAVAASGGVKNDHVNPSGDAAKGFGNVPFHREEYTAERINAYFNVDLAQLRGYGLGPEPERLLLLLALYKIRRLLDGDLRFRTACDFTVTADSIGAMVPAAFLLPALVDLEAALPHAVEACAGQMAGKTVVTYVKK